MSQADLEANERTSLLHHDGQQHQPRERDGHLAIDEDVESTVLSHVSKEEQLLSDTAVGERLPYNDYTTIDWLHDLVGIIPIPPWLVDCHFI